MISLDKTTRLILVWIAVMLTVIAAKEIFQVPMLLAQEGAQVTPKLKSQEPIEVVIKGPVAVKISDWNAYPSQPFKVKIDEPWPARIEITDEVKIRGELKLRE